MKKLYLCIMCLLLVAVMILTACANKTAGPSDEMLKPANQIIAETDNLSSAEKESSVFNISTDFNKSRASNNVTIEEVEKIIVLAREVYSKYDTVIVDAENTYKTVDVPDLTLEKVEKLSVDDQQILDFEESLGAVRTIIEKMFSQYFPEDSVLIMNGKTNFPYPDYYFLDLESAGCENAQEAFDKMLENGTPSFDRVADCVYVIRKNIFFYDADTDESMLIFPNDEESAMRSYINDKRVARDQDPEYYIKLHGLDTE